MRPTIKDLQLELSALNRVHGYVKGDLEDHKKHAEQMGTELARLKNEIARLHRDAAHNAEILQLTRELLGARTDHLAVVTGKAPSVMPPVVDPDVLMFGATQLSRRDVEEQGSKFGSPFIGTVKYVREQAGVGLKEAKDFCDVHFAHLKTQY